MLLTGNQCVSNWDIIEFHFRRLSKKFDYRVELPTDFRQSFKKEYLSELVQKHTEKHTREPRVGKVVLVGIDNEKRILWTSVTLIQLIHGRNSRVSTIKLKTQHEYLVQSIFPLEIHSNETKVIASKKSCEEKTSSSKYFGHENVFSPDRAKIKKYTSLEDV